MLDTVVGDLLLRLMMIGNNLPSLCWWSWQSLLEPNNKQTSLSCGGDRRLDLGVEQEGQSRSTMWTVGSFERVDIMSCNGLIIVYRSVGEKCIDVDAKVSSENEWSTVVVPVSSKVRRRQCHWRRESWMELSFVSRERCEDYNSRHAHTLW